MIFFSENSYILYSISFFFCRSCQILCFLHTIAAISKRLICLSHCFFHQIATQTCLIKSHLSISGLKSRVMKLPFLNLKMIVKSGLEFILKLTKPIQSCCCPVQKCLPRMAELAWQLSRYL